MKSVTAAFALAFAAAAALDAAAQHCPPGMDGPSKAPEMVALRYYTQKADGPATLEKALSQIRCVKKVSVDKRYGTVTVAWSGKCTDLALLETLAANAGVPALLVSHARATLTLKPLRHASTDVLRRQLASLDGIKCAEVSGHAAVIHADFRVLGIGALRDAAQMAGFEAQLNTHACLGVKTSGDLNKALEELSRLSGVLTVAVDGDTLTLWATKAATDAAIRKTLEGAGAAVDEIRRD